MSNQTPDRWPSTATYSIVAVDPAADEMGVAVQSKFLAIGAVVPFARARVGAIATQCLANTSYGPEGLSLLEQGFSPRRVLERLIERDSDRRFRQVAIVDRFGNAAAFTGLECYPYSGHQCGKFYAVQGTLLQGKNVLKAMASAFQSHKGILADRMIAALEAAEAAGGDRRGEQSAALLVVRPRGGYGGYSDRFIDLRVDDAKKPIQELRRLLDLYRLYFFRPEGGDLLKLEGKIVNEVQKGLKKKKYYNGPVNGNLTDTLKKALLQFHHEENLEARWSSDMVIDRTVLGILKK